MKKILMIMLCILIAILTGCGRMSDSEKVEDNTYGKTMISIYTTKLGSSLDSYMSFISNIKNSGQAQNKSNASQGTYKEKLKNADQEYELETLVSTTKENAEKLKSTEFVKEKNDTLEADEIREKAQILYQTNKELSDLSQELLDAYKKGLYPDKMGDYLQNKAMPFLSKTRDKFKQEK